MSEENPEAKIGTGVEAPAGAAHTGSRLLESIDQRIHAKSGTKNPPSGEVFLTALDEYLQTREALAQKKKDEETKPTRKDLVWMWAFVGGVLLLGTLIPDSFFEKLRYKEYGEKILTYAVGAGLLSKWVRSPKEFIQASRTKRFRRLAGTLLVVSAALTVKVVRVHALIDPRGTQVYLDDSKEPERNDTFRMRLKGMEVKLVKPETRNDKERARPLSISLLNLLSHARLSARGILVEPRLRMDNDVLLECLEDDCATPVTLTFKLQDAEFDDTFVGYLITNQLNYEEHPAAFDLKFDKPNQVELRLLPGKYKVEAKTKTCSEELKQPLMVGAKLPATYTVEMEKCVQ